MDAYEVVKSGEVCLRITLSRSDIGIKVNVKTSPIIESFMQGLGNGEKQPVEAHGRQWVADKGAEPLYVYAADKNPLTAIQTNRYSLQYVGRGLDLVQELGHNDAVNLAFLRLVGASEGNGVTFHIKGAVHSLDGLRELKNKIGSAARTLYVDFIRPVDLTVYVTQVSSQEVSY